MTEHARYATTWTLPLVLSLAAGLLFSEAQAQRMYKCTDAKGKTYYTQTPPAECQGRDTQILSGKSGSVVQKIEGQITPEEQARRDEEKKKKAAADELAREERRKNTALLNTYSSEKDIDEARARALKENDAAIKETEKRIANSLKRKKELDNEKEFFVKKTLPAKLEQDIKSNDVDLKNQQALLEVQQKQVANINTRFDADKKRYQDLTKNSVKR